MIPHKEPLYLFAGSFVEARKIALHCDLADDEWVYISKDVPYFMRGRKRRKIYFCGSWHDRGDEVSIAHRLAVHYDWDIIYGLPLKNHAH